MAREGVTMATGYPIRPVLALPTEPAMPSSHVVVQVNEERYRAVRANRDD